MSNEVLQLLEKAASELGIAVEYLWEVLIRQYYVKGITHIVIAAIGIILLTLIIFYTPRIYKTVNERYKSIKKSRVEDGTGFNGTTWLSSFEEDRVKSILDDVIPMAITFGLIILVVVVICLVCGIHRLYNPDYYAIQEIMNIIGSAA